MYFKSRSLIILKELYNLIPYFDLINIENNLEYILNKIKDFYKDKNEEKINYTKKLINQYKNLNNNDIKEGIKELKEYYKNIDINKIKEDDERKIFWNFSINILNS